MNNLSVVTAVSGEGGPIVGSSAPSIFWIVFAIAVMIFVLGFSRWHVYDKPDGRPIYVSALLLGVAVGFVALQSTFYFRDELLGLSDNLTERARRNLELFLAWGFFFIFGIATYVLRKNVDENG